MVQSDATIPKTNSWYDELLFKPLYLEFFENSDFANYGYWDEATTGPRQACENLVQRLLDKMPDKSGKILDVACGKGETSRYVSRYYPADQIVGINISQAQLDACRGNVPGATFLEMDATNLNFPSASIGNVLCVEAAFHFNTRRRFLEEAHRVLKPGGVVALSDILMTREAEVRRPYRSEANFLAHPDEYVEMLKSIGFKRVHVEDVTEKCWFGFYRYTVQFLHEKFLRRQIDRETLMRHLETNYGHVNDLEYYLIVAAEK